MDFFWAGILHEHNLFYEHRILLLLKAKGSVVEIKPAGNYTVDTPVFEIDENSTLKKYYMDNFW